MINIRTDKFSKEEIKAIEETLKKWDYEWIVEIIYIGEGKGERIDVSFTLEQENLGEFIWLIFGCGLEFVYDG